MIYIIFISIFFIVFYAFWNTQYTSFGGILLKLFFFIVTLFMIFLFFTFGPWVYIEYNPCTTKEDINISNNSEVYEIVYKKGYTRYTYDAPLLCIKEHPRSSLCQDDGYVQYKKINTKDIHITGRIIKMYALNAFTSNSYDVEVIINHKYYWIGANDYDILKNRHKDFEQHIESFCPFYTIKDFTVLH